MRWEILIVDDGSTKTIRPRSLTVTRKNIRGSAKRSIRRTTDHGAAVNAGLKAATGIYFKVVDQ